MSSVLAELPNCLEKNSGSGEISIYSWYVDHVQAIDDKLPGDAVLLTGLTPTEARAWAELLGPLALADGGTVNINLEPLADMITLSAADDRQWMTPVKFSAFQSALGIHTAKHETYMQTLDQKDSAANATFDNPIKVLSSTIAGMLEADKNFLNI